MGPTKHYRYTTDIARLLCCLPDCLTLLASSMGAVSAHPYSCPTMGTVWYHHVSSPTRVRWMLTSCCSSSAAPVGHGPHERRQFFAPTGSSNDRAVLRALQLLQHPRSSHKAELALTVTREECAA